jgi:predicted lysophospholipase L1 biosynthesis ABC-type transport system permease subunit
MALTFRILLASDMAAFAVLFGIFVVALLVLIVITLRWVFRRDKAGRIAWREQQLARQGRPPGTTSAASSAPSRAAATETQTPAPPTQDPPDQ